MSALERSSRIEAFFITTLSCPYFASLRRMFWQSMRSVGEVSDEVSETFQPKKILNAMPDGKDMFLVYRIRYPPQLQAMLPTFCGLSLLSPLHPSRPDPRDEKAGCQSSPEDLKQEGRSFRGSSRSSQRQTRMHVPPHSTVP